MKFVLDASAILSGKDLNASKDYFTTNSIINELTSKKAKRKIEYLGVKISSPCLQSLNFVKEKAKELGEIKRLSKNDLELIALAKDLNGTILTDDYSIQNLCSAIKIKYQGISENEIKKKVVWKYKCKGCEKIYENELKECLICGSELRTIRGKEEEI